MVEYLFAYGTLIPGRSPDGIAPAVNQLQWIGEATVRGVLYDLGEFPGAVLDVSSDRTISGRVFRLPPDPKILTHFDRYEEFDPNFPECSLFVRKRHPVTLATGEVIPCWIYVYNGKPDQSRILEDGRYPRITTKGNTST